MIGVDWGTSSFRAFRLTDDGHVRDRVQAARGILTISPGGFAAALADAVGPWMADGETRILLAGMVGSRQGWVEAPYLPCPAGPAELAAALVPVGFDRARVLLVPGLTDRDAQGTPEVMRGEETQVAGVLADLPPNALACLPGSHSKWARVEAGRIVSFRTYLSGEAFAALRSGTILGRMMPEGAPHETRAFARGVERSGDPGHLLHHLFGVRTLALTGGLAEAGTASYLSGLLIGHEVRAALPARGTVHLVGAAGLTTLYSEAVTQLGGMAKVLTEDAAASGMAMIGTHASWT